MKKVVIASVIILMAAGVAWCLTADDGRKLSGWHETLNIIGVQNPKKTDMDAVEAEHGIGSTIFVNLEGKSRINLVVGDEFAVLDKNGTDADGATFQMLDPGLDPYVIGGDMAGVDTMADYSIYVRPLGKPGGWATITTCAQVVESSLISFLSATDINILNDACEWGGYASVEQVGQDVTLRTKGKTTFANVTAELTTIVLQVQILDAVGAVVDTVYVRIPIFDPMLEGEYWQYDNHGLKHLQVRIYMWETDVSLNDGPFLP